MEVKNDEKKFKGKTTDDTLKNFFKIICSIYNIPLKQRYNNLLDDKTLCQFLDTVNFDMLDDELIVLNQLATIKRLANRKAFSVT